MSEVERLSDAQHVLFGEGSDGAIRRLLYAMYLSTLFLGIYGFTVIRASIDRTDPRWLRDLLDGPGALGVAVALLIAPAAVGFVVGRTRGPVVPPLPWIDHLVATDLDRALTLRRWGVLSLSGGLGVGLLAGGVLGGATVAAGSAGPLLIPLAAAGGAVAGVVGAIGWLAGQVGKPDGRTRPRTLDTALRGLRIEDLRTHSLRTAHLGGTVLAGDLRAARLDVAAPISRGRGLRLRATGPRRMLVRRDLLGLRRQPGRIVVGAVLSAFGATGVSWSFLEPRAPAVLACLSMGLCYFGFGAWCEGLRMVADNAGTPPLLGMRFAAQARAHLVLPSALFLVVAVAAGSLLAALAEPGSVGRAAGWVALVTLVVAGANTMAAFRGAPPDLAFVPEMGPLMMIVWYCRPLTLSCISAGLLTARATDAPYLIFPFFTLAMIGVGAVLFGMRRARGVEEAHRI